MARQNGDFAFSNNFEVAKAAPLDARVTTPTYAQLTSLPFAYKGMLVSVTGDGSNNGVYRLTADDASVASNWARIDPVLATVASTGDYDDLSNKPSLFNGVYASLSGRTEEGGFRDRGAAFLRNVKSALDNVRPPFAPPLSPGGRPGRGLLRSSTARLPDSFCAHKVFNSRLCLCCARTVCAGTTTRLRNFPSPAQLDVEWRIRELGAQGCAERLGAVELGIRPG